MYYIVKIILKSYHLFWHSLNQLVYSIDEQVNTTNTVIPWNPRSVLRVGRWKREIHALVITS